MLMFFIHEVKARAGSIMGWGLGMAGFVLLYVGLYPSFVDQVPNFEELLELPIYQALGITTMTTYSGWVSSTVLNFLPIIVGVFALIAGTATLAGEEEAGTLENIVTLPLARWQIAASKYLAILVILLGILLVTALVAMGVTVWVTTQVEIDVSQSQILVAILAAFPLLSLLAAAALFLGTFLPTRAAANGVSIALLIASYLSNNLFGQIENLERYRFVSPFYYYDSSATAFSEGPAAADILTLSLLALLFFALAALSFERRDLTTHAWFWQRPREAQA